MSCDLFYLCFQFASFAAIKTVYYNDTLRVNLRASWPEQGFAILLTTHFFGAWPYFFLHFFSMIFYTKSLSSLKVSKREVAFDFQLPLSCLQWLCKNRAHYSFTPDICTLIIDNTLEFVYYRKSKNIHLLWFELELLLILLSDLFYYDLHPIYGMLDATK